MRNSANPYPCERISQTRTRASNRLLQRAASGAATVGPSILITGSNGLESESSGSSARVSPVGRIGVSFLVARLIVSRAIGSGSLFAHAGGCAGERSRRRWSRTMSRIPEAAFRER